MLSVSIVAHAVPASAQSSTIGTVVIANGWSSADSAVASALAAQQSNPNSGAVVLYAEAKSLPTRTAEFLQTRRPSRVTLIGGTKALSPAVQADIARLSGSTTPTRIDGTDRFDTAAKAVPATATTFIVANGYSAADTGVAAALAAVNANAAVLLATKDSLTPATERILRERKPKRVEFVGGTAVLADELADRVSELAPSITKVPRHSGASRTDTAADAAPDSATTLVVANGWSPADTGVAAALAAITPNAAVLYATPTSLTTPTADRITKLQPTAVVLIGGTAALSSTLHRTVHCLSPSATISRVSGADRIDTAVRAALGTLTPVDTNFRCGTSGSGGGGGGGPGGGGDSPARASDAPSAVTVIARHQRLEVSWTAAAGSTVTGYDIEYRACTATDTTCTADDASWGAWTDWGPNGNSTATGVTITGLANGTAYQVRVRAANAQGHSPWSTPSSEYPSAAPDTPDAPTLTVGNAGLGVSWLAPEPNGAAISDYDIRWCIHSSGCDADSDWTALDDTGENASDTTTSTTITGLANNTAYQVQVRAANRSGDSNWSPSTTAAPKTPATAKQKPGPPGGLTATARHKGLALSWTAPQTNPQTVSRYEVQHCDTEETNASCDDGSGTDWSTPASTGSGNTSFEISGLDNGTAYKTRVRAVGSGGASAWSPSVQGTPAKQPPDAPAIQQSTPTANGLVVKWKEPDNNGDGVSGYDVRYRVQQSNAWPTTWTAHPHSGTATEATIAHLTPASLSQGAAGGASAASATASANANYQVQVRAENSIGAGPWSAQPPDAPPQPTVGSLNKSLSVQWAKPTENGSATTGYDVQYRACTNTNDLTCASNPTWASTWSSHAHTGTGTVATITGLTNGTRYQVQVRAKSSAGNSGWSASGLGTPAARKPDVPSAPKLTPKDKTLEVSWRVPASNGADITDYDVQYCDNSTDCDAASEWTEWNADDTSTTTSATITGLTNDTAYQVQVRATNSVGDGAWSASSNGTPAAGSPSTPPPDPPSAPTVKPTHQALEVSWSRPANNGSPITDYAVQYRACTATNGNSSVLTCATNPTWASSWSSHAHTGTGTSTTITGLPNGTAYQVQVRAASAAGNSDWSASADGTPAAKKPNAPAAPSLTSTDEELGVSWTAPALNGSPITDYDVQYRACTAADKTCATNATWASTWTARSGETSSDTTTSATLGGLTNGTAYQVQVRAANSAGEGGWSSSASGIPAKAPDAPSAPTLSVRDESLGVEWTEPTATGGAPITDYDVQYRACTATPKTCTTSPTWGAWKSLSGTADPGKNATATISNLTNGTAYEVRVRAANRAGQSGWSSSASAVPAAVPDAPAAPTPVVWNAELRVSWSPPAANGSPITDYDVRYQACTATNNDTNVLTCATNPTWGNWTQWNANDDSTTTSATITGLTNDTAYQVQVRAGNSIGDGAYSASRKATPAAQKPDTPDAPTLTRGNASLSATWTAPIDNGSAISDYDVQYRACTASDKTCATSPSWGSWTNRPGETNGDTATTASITGLTNGTAYQVRVRAGNAKGDSGWSTAASEVPSTKPDVPAAPTLAVGDVSLGVTWTAPASDGGSPITDYDVRYCDNSTGCDAASEWTEWNASDDSTTTSATITNLTNGTAYQVQVRATNSEGDSAWSNSTTATPAKAPDAPSAPTLTVWNKELRVSWTAPTDNGASISDYDVQYRGCTATPKSCASNPTWGTWREWNANDTSTTLSATITGLTNDTAYQVQARATNSVGDGAWSSSASGTPTAQKPDAPAAPTLSSGDESLSVSWTAPANNGSSITDYDVRYCDNSTGCDAASEWTALNDTGDNATDTGTTDTISSLTNGTAYQVQVRAGNSVGDSAWSASATEYPSTAPDAPAAPTLTVQHQALGVSWTAPSGNGGSAITDYDVRYCTNSTGCDAASEWTEWQSGNTSTTRSATITGLTNGTAYQVQVRAGNRSGDSSWSASATATPAKVPATPSAPTLTAQHQGLGVSWTAPADNGSSISDYDVQYRACTATDKTCATNPDWADTWTSHSHSGTGTAATITGLTNGTAYQVQVRATNGVGDSAWSASADEYPSTTPGTPGTPTLTVADRGLGVSWTAPSSNGGSAITGYKMGRCSASCDTASNWTVTATTGTGTTASLTGLTNGTAYQVRVAATNRSGDSSWSSSATATPAKAPSRPSAPSLAVWNAELRVSWTAPADNGEAITDYDVRYCKNSTGCDADDEWTEWNANDDSTTTSATITGLTNDTAYRVQVRATNGIGDSAWSSSATATPTAQKPAAPAAPTLSYGNQSVSASWSAPEDNGDDINDYDVRYRACTNTNDLTCATNPTWAGTWSSHAHTGTGTSATITGLTNGTAYQVQVRAGNSKGKSGWSPSAAKTPSAKPGTPSAPTLTVKHESLDVSWTAPAANGSAITDYDMRYCTNSTGCDAAGEWTEWNANDTSTSTSATITNLTNGTAYQVQVRATNGEGDSAWSSSATATPAKAPDAPSAPTVAVWNKELRVSWTAPTANGAAITDYDVQYRACTNTNDLTCATNPSWATNWTEWNADDTSTALAATITGLTNDTAYQVQVRATNSVGDSSWSTATKKTPTAQKPTTPAAPTVTHASTSLGVSWAAPSANGSAITDYDVQYRACTKSTDLTCSGSTSNSDWGSWAEWNASNNSTTTSATITGLTNGTAYQVEVRATNGKGDSAWSDSASEHPSAAPSAPGAPTLAVNDVSLGVSWTAPAANGSAITDYDVQYRACTATDKTCTNSPSWGNWTEWNAANTSTTTSATITGLTNGTAYEVQVRAGNRSGDGSWSTSATATPAKAPDAPSSVTVTSRHLGLGVSWTAPSSNGAAISDYDVQYRACTNTNDLTCKTNPAWADDWTNRSGETTADTAISVTLASLTNGTAYQVRVRAANSVSEGNWSSEATGTPAIQAPDAPSAPTLAVDNASLAVSWAQPTTNGASVTDYDVRYRACNKSGDLTCATNPSWAGWTNRTGETTSDTGTSATIGSLTNGTAYQVQVRAANSVGEGAWSASATASPAPQKPSAPATPTLTHGDESLDVSWTAPANNGASITDYDVRYCDNSTGCDDASEWTALDDTNSSTTTSATISSLTNGTTYQVQVRAGNSVGDGPWSPSTTEYPSTTPGTPAAPSLTAGDQSLALSWTAPTGNGGSALTGYKLRYRVADTDSGQSGNQPGNWKNHSHTGTGTTNSISGLTNDTAYDVQVRATNRSGDGAWSASATATPAKAPDAPSAPTLTKGATQLSVSWSAPDDNGAAITDYDVRYRACTKSTDLSCSGSTNNSDWAATWSSHAHTGTGRSATITGLTNGTAYQVQVRATNAQGTGSWSASAKAAPEDKPKKPAAPSLSVWNASLNVSWTAPVDNGQAITDYDVQYRACTKAGDLTCASNPTWADDWSDRSGETNSDTATSATVSGLTNGTAYQVRVRATNSVGDSAWSDATAATPAAQKPDQPSAPTVVVWHQELRISWTAPAANGASISDYDVRYRACTQANDLTCTTNPTWGNWTTLTGSDDPGTNTTATIDTLTNGTKYQVQVQATNSVGDSAWSGTASGTPATQAPDAPSAPTVAVWHQELRVSWTEPTTNGASITDYDVRYRACTQANDLTCTTNPTWGNWTTLTGSDDPGTNTTTDIDTLTNGTKYQVQVQATNSVGDSAWSGAASGTPTAQKPDAPSAPTLTKGATQLSVSWSAPTANGASITDYDVRYRVKDTNSTTPGDQPGSWTTLAGGQTGGADPGTATSATITGLTNGTAYQVQARGTNSVGTGDWSASASAAPEDAPAAPAAPTLTYASTSLTATWTAPAANGQPISDYDVRYRVKDTNSTTPGDQPGSWNSLSGSDDPGTATTADIDGLTNGTTYQVQVRATNSVGTGSWSASANEKPSTVPGKPTAVTLTIKDQSLGVSWTAPTATGGADITGYKTEHCDNSTGCDAASEWTSTTHTGTGTTATITGLNNGRSYQVRVAATNRSGDSAWSTAATETPAAKPDTPAAPTVTMLHQKLRVSWTAPANNGAAISDYDMQYRVKDTNSTTPGDQPGDWTTLTGSDDPGTATTATITGLTNSTAYQVQVRATNAQGTSDWSDSTDGTPAPQKPDAPTAPELTVQHQSLDASWTAPTANGAAISDYDVRYRVKDTNSTQTGDQPGDWTTLTGSDDPGTATTATVTGLTNGTAYQVQARATNSVGTGAWSASASATPAPQPPNQPAAPALSAGHQLLSAVWLPPAANGSAITGYNVQYRACTATDGDTTVLTCATNPTWADSWTPHTHTGTGTLSTISGLTNGTAYQVQVRATSAVGNSAWSSSTAGSPAPTKPDTPAAPTVSARHQGLAVSWTEPATNGSAITDYDVRYRACTATPKSCATSPTWGSWTNRTGETTADTDTSATVTGLTNGTAYQVQVRAANSVDESGWSTAGQAIPAIQAPDAPATPTLTLANQEISVAWTAPATNGSAITGYNVRYRPCTKSADLTCAGSTAETDWASSWTTHSGTGTALSRDIKNLTTGTAYQVQVRAVNAVGNSQWSVTATGIPANVPSRPKVTLSSVAGEPLKTRVAWTVEDNGGLPVTGYEITYRCSPGFGWAHQIAKYDPWSVAAGTTSRDSEVPFCNTQKQNGLPNWEYRIMVRAKNVNGWGLYTYPFVKTAKPTVIDRSAITASVTTTQTGTQMSVSWTAPADGGLEITDYDLRYRTKDTDDTQTGDQPGSWTTLSGGADPGTATSATITGLTANEVYEIAVRASNKMGVNEWSTEADWPQVPATPDAPTVTAKNRALDVSWTAPSGGGVDITDYDVRYRACTKAGDLTCATNPTWAGTWTTLTGAADPGTATSAAIGSLTNETAYQVEVKATNGIGDSAWSTATVATPTPQAPDAPAAPTLTISSATSLGASWTAPTANGATITDYDVRYRACTATPKSCATSPTWATDWTSLTGAADPGSSTTATIGSLTKATAYQVQVRAANSVGSGAWSASTVGIPASAPGAPAAPTLTALHQSLSVSWTAPASDGGSALTDYDVRYRACTATNGDSAVLTCATSPTWATDWTSLTGSDDPGTTLAATITGLTNGTAYQVQVRASNLAGAGSWSTAARKAPAIQKPGAPKTLTLTVKHKSLKASWAEPVTNGGAITDYDVRYRACTATPKSCATSPTWGDWQNRSGETTTDTDLSATVTGLTNGTAYQVQVRAANSVGEGPWTDSAKAIPQPQVPDAPNAPATNYDNNTIEVTWNAPAANGSTITHYQVRHRIKDNDADTPGNQPSHWTTMAKSSGTAKSLDSLTNGVTREVQVRAKSNLGDSAWSASADGTPWGKPSKMAKPTLTRGDQQIVITWTPPPEPVEWYLLQVEWPSHGNQCGQGVSFNVTGGTTSRTVTHVNGAKLTNGRQYCVKIGAKNRVGRHDHQNQYGPWSDYSYATPAGKPAAPAAPTLTVNNTSLGVSWTAPSNNGDAITDYDIQYRIADTDQSTEGNQPGSWTDHDHTGTGTTATIGSLTNGTAYDVQVQATNAVGDSAWSSSATATPAKRPAAPRAPTVSARHQALAVTWTEPTTNGAPITDYDVQYSACTATPKDCSSSPAWGSWTTLTGSDDPGTKTAATIGSLTNGTKYRVQVRAANSQGTSGWSSSGSAVPAPQAPEAPAAPSLTVWHTELRVSWTAPTANGAAITDYNVQYRACTATPKTCATNPTWGGWQTHAHTGTGTSATVTGLTNGTAYQVQVQATNSKGNSPWSPSATATPTVQKPDTPAAPTLSYGNGSLSVSWTAPDDNGASITGYRVRRCDDSKDCSAGSSNWSPKDISGNTTSTTLTGLTNGTTYQVQVRAKNSVGNSPFSSSSKEYPSTVPSAPGAPTLTVKHQALGVSWSAPANGGSALTDYDVRYCDASSVLCDQDSQWTTWPHSGTGTSTNITGLTNGTGYKVQVKAKNRGGFGSWSSSGSATPATKPSAPGAPTLTSGDSKLSVSWTAPANGGASITDYDVQYRACTATDKTCASSPSWGSWTSHTHTGAGTSTDIGSLTNGTKYQVQVNAANSQGRSGWSSSAGEIPYDEPAAPGAPTLTHKHQELDVSWSAPTDTGGAPITDYDVQYRACNKSGDLKCAGNSPTWGNWTTLSGSDDPGTSTTATIDSLTNGTAYQVQVRASNKIGAGAWSASAKEHPSTTPGAPGAPTLTVKSASLDVSWSAPSATGGAAISDYDVQYRACTNASDLTCATNPTWAGTWTEWNSGNTSTTTTATITGLTNSTAYQVQVRAANRSGDGAWSASASATPLPQKPSAPAAPTLTVKNRSLDVSWSAPDAHGAPITDYDVRRRACTATDKTCATSPKWGNWSEWNSGNTSTATTATITGLTNGTKYEVQVRAGNAKGDSDWSASTAAIPATTPGTPGQPTLRVTPGTQDEPISSQQIGVSWTAPSSDGGSPISGYKVQHCDNSTGCDADDEWTTNTHTGTTATISNLTNGTAYRVRVAATNSIGDSSWSSYRTATPRDKPSTPEAPTLVSGNASLAVSWTAPASNGSNITGYKVRWCGGENASCYDDTSTDWKQKNSSTTSTSVSGLTNGTAYRVKVRASNAAGDSDWSTETEGTPGAPAAPGQPTLTRGDSRLTVTWTAPSNRGDTISSYTVAYCNSANDCTDNNNWSEENVSDRTDPNDPDSKVVTTHALTGLTNGTTYTVRVRADNLRGSGGWSPTRNGTPATTPGTPTSLTLTAKSRGLDVSWTAPTDDGGSAITGSKVQYRACTATPKTCTGDTPTWGSWVSRNVSGGGATTYSITGLTNGTKYEVQVAAVNNVGTGSYTSSTSATPAALPSKPTNLAVEAKHEALQVSWTAAVGNGSVISGYDVQYRACNKSADLTCASSPTWGAWQTHTHDDTATTTSIDTLTNGTKYQVQVQAKSNNGNSGWTTSVSGTPAAVPDAPDEPTLTSGDTQISVSWSAPANDNGSTVTDYDVRYRKCTATPKTCASSANSTWGSWSNRSGETTSDTATSATLASLTNGTAYQVQVRAQNANGEGPWSSAAKETPAGKPTKPSTPTVTTGDQELTVTWTAPSDNGSAITGYNLQYCTSTSDCTDDTNWTEDSPSDTSLSHTITGLTNSTTYKVRLRATNSVGSGPWSSEASGTPIGKPSYPDTVEIASGGARLIVSWSTPTSNGATVNGFKLRYCNTNDSNKDCSSDYDDWTTVTVSGGSTRTKTITGLTNGDSYDVEIATRSSNGGDSDWYSAGSGTPGAPNAPSAPSLTAGSGQITVRWSAPAKNHSDITGYEIAYCNDTDGDCTSGTWQTEYPWDLTTLSYDLILDSGKRYKVRVRASNDQGSGAWSSAATATTT